MSSADKIEANRANARASTGPKTKQGRARSARNALRHALSTPVDRDPVLSEEVKALAREIAGPNANAEIQELAGKIAEAQIDLRRVRHLRKELLSGALSNRYYEPRASTRKKLKFIGSLLKPNTPDMPIELVTEVITTTPQGSHKFATILSEEAKKLWALDRYERRALSRRKFAIREFDEARHLCVYISNIQLKILQRLILAERSQNMLLCQGDGISAKTRKPIYASEIMESIKLLRILIKNHAVEPASLRKPPLAV